MKVKTTTPERKQRFEPFTIEITFEKLDEAREMWHRLNVVDFIPESTDVHPYPQTSSLYPVWDAISSQIEKHEL